MEQYHDISKISTILHLERVNVVGVISQFPNNAKNTNLFKLYLYRVSSKILSELHFSGRAQLDSRVICQDSPAVIENYGKIIKYSI